jgi:hypothetical protein
MLRCVYCHTIINVSSQPGPLESAVQRALAVVPTTDADRGTTELAVTYARSIDDGGDLAKLGPPLLAALAALGMTPVARAALVKGGTRAGPVASPLDELRARRVARAG